MTARDFDKQPYSADEARIAKYFAARGVGGGDDPVGFMLSSYAYIVAQRNTLREIIVRSLAKLGPD